MPKTKRKKSKRRSNSNGKSGAIHIRMYNVGFGDCFLVTVPSSDGPKRILFDCGSIAAADGVSIDDVLAQLWKDTTDPGEDHPRIDVVVATHRHRDHVSGFAKPGWEKVEVREVWMPWTEHPTDPEARRIRNAQAGLAANLHATLTAKLNAAPAGSPERTKFDQARELAANALSNEKAMTTLHEGFRGKPARQFLPLEKMPGLTLDADRTLPSLSVFVLGPSRDESVIRDMDPPSGKSYLQLMSSQVASRAPEPFSSEWRIEPSKYLMSTADPTSGLWKWFLHVLTTTLTLPQLSQQDMDAIAKAGETEFLAAVALDKAVNGTSLMLVLKIGATHLLFPGDAQWGTWQAAMKNSVARDLMKRTKFCKIGHHGSHNATPTEFVETILQEDTFGMISTRPIDQWPDIPRQPLLDALKLHKCTFVRSDKMTSGDKKVFQCSGDLYVDIEVPIE